MSKVSLGVVIGNTIGIFVLWWFKWLGGWFVCWGWSWVVSWCWSWVVCWSRSWDWFIAIAWGWGFISGGNSCDGSDGDDL